MSKGGATLADLVFMYFIAMTRYSGQVQYSGDGTGRVESEELDLLCNEILVEAAKGRELSANELHLMKWAEVTHG